MIEWTKNGAEKPIAKKELIFSMEQPESKGHYWYFLGHYDDTNRKVHGQR